jgi:hypothetical protein
MTHEESNAVLTPGATLDVLTTEEMITRAMSTYIQPKLDRIRTLEGALWATAWLAREAGKPSFKSWSEYGQAEVKKAASIIEKALKE